MAPHPRPRPVKKQVVSPAGSGETPLVATRTTRSTVRRASGIAPDEPLGPGGPQMNRQLAAAEQNCTSQRQPGKTRIAEVSHGTKAALKRKLADEPAVTVGISQPLSSKKGRIIPSKVAADLSSDEDAPLHTARSHRAPRKPAPRAVARDQANIGTVRGSVPRGKQQPKKKAVAEDDPFETADESGTASDGSLSSLTDANLSGNEDDTRSDEDDGLGSDRDDGQLAGLLEVEQPSWTDATDGHPALTGKGKGKARSNSRFVVDEFDVSSGSEFEDLVDDEMIEDAELEGEEEDEEWVTMVAARAERSQNKARAQLTTRQQLEQPVWNELQNPASTIASSSAATSASVVLGPSLFHDVNNDDFGDLMAPPLNPLVPAPDPIVPAPVVVPPAPVAVPPAPVAVPPAPVAVPLAPVAVPLAPVAVPPAPAVAPAPVAVAVAPVAVAPVAVAVAPAPVAPAAAPVPPVAVNVAAPLNALNAAGPGPALANNIPNILPPAAYTIVLNPSGGPPLLNRQHTHIQRAVRGSLPRLEVYLVTENAFPDAITAAQFITLSLVEVAQQDGNTGLVLRLNTDHDFLRSLVAMARQRVSTFRLAVKRVADANVAAQYAINPANAVDKVNELFEWMKYIYPFTSGTDGRCTVPWDKPYLNECVVVVLRSAFVNTNPHSMLNDHPDVFASTLALRPEEIEIPMVMAGLVATAIHAAISEWRLGFHRPASFSADAFVDIYQEHMLILRTAKEKNPRGYHNLMHRLYMLVTLQVLPAPAVGMNALAHVDFAGLGA